MTVIKAHFDGNNIVLDEPANLKPNAKVKIIVEEEYVGKDSASTSELHEVKAVFGKPIKTGIKDLAEQHDHYLYGTPKTEPNS